MDCSTPDFPVHHQLLELIQTHVHWVGDTIQLSHPELWLYGPLPVKWCLCFLIHWKSYEVWTLSPYRMRAGTRTGGRALAANWKRPSVSSSKPWADWPLRAVIAQDSTEALSDCHIKGTWPLLLCSLLLKHLLLQTVFTSAKLGCEPLGSKLNIHLLRISNQTPGTQGNLIIKLMNKWSLAI